MLKQEPLSSAKLATAAIYGGGKVYAVSSLLLTSSRQLQSKGREWRHVMHPSPVVKVDASFYRENDTDCSERIDEHVNTLLLIAQSRGGGLTSNFHRVFLTCLAIHRYQTFHIVSRRGIYSLTGLSHKNESMLRLIE